MRSPADGRPGLGDAIDPAAMVGGRAQGRAIGKIRPPVPGPVPGRLQGRLEPGNGPLQFFRVRLPAIGPGDGRKAPVYRQQEPAQPYAFPAPLADLVHAVVPVAPLHIGQTMGAKPGCAADGPHTMAVQGLRRLPRLHPVIQVPLPFRQGPVRQICHRHIQYVHVLGGLQVIGQHIGQKQPIVHDAGPYPPHGHMPPMEHVPRRELPPRAQEQLLPHPRRLHLKQGQHILELIPEAHGAAALIVSRPGHEPGRVHLIQQPAVD